ncbi:angiopoietin-2-like [Mya arenaria]|uniref:angiopoietin-2-like n=1 Tax=Mya arenaria TaxID=6604 RepID=UPI0022E8FCF2|nr:angiopoietin-2-like [Mya arenaria]
MALCKANMLFVLLTIYTVALYNGANANEVLIEILSKVLTLDTKFDNLETEFMKTVNDVNTLDKRMDNMEIQLKNKLTDYTPKLGGITKSIESTISNTVTKMVKSQYRAISTAMKREKVALMTLKTEIKNHIKEIDDEFQNVQTSFEERLLNQTQAQEYKFERQSDDLGDFISDVRDQLKGNLSDAQKSLDQAIHAFKDDIKNTTFNLNKTLNENLETIQSEVDLRITDQQNGIVSLNSKMSSTEGSLQSYKSFSNSIRADVNSIDSRVSLIETSLSETQWSDWGKWTVCDTRCERGKWFRERLCNNPVPQFGGAGCSGDKKEVRASFDCSEVRQNLGRVPSGVYHITTWKTNQIASVFCDMDTDQGGWTVFQHRMNGNVDFYRNFSSYENGFGSLQGEFWFGLKLMYEMTSRTSNDLRIDITRGSGSTGYIVYADFSVGAGSNYTLHVGNIRSKSGLRASYVRIHTYHNGSAFSTFDHDNDRFHGVNCAATHRGGWWYKYCIYYMNLNGQYYTPGKNDDNGTAMTFDEYTTLKSSKMMFRHLITVTIRDATSQKVFQHRMNGKVDFYRNFSSYENGFGLLQGEFWLGLKLMNEMTSRTSNDLRIDITHSSGYTGYIVYADFNVGAGSNYTLHVGNTLSERGVYADLAGFNTYNNCSAFSTFDHDNDLSSSSNCAVILHGGWWYNDCIYCANLNGHYHTPGTYVLNKTAMTFDGYQSLKTSKMMFRP